MMKGMQISRRQSMRVLKLCGDSSVEEIVTNAYPGNAYLNSGYEHYRGDAEKLLGFSVNDYPVKE